MDIDRVPPIIRERRERLIRNSTPSENRLLPILEILCEREDISLSFQHPIRIGPHSWAFADFLIDGSLILELDGAHHQNDENQIRRDKRRDACLRQLGYKVIRRSNFLVKKDAKGLALFIVKKALRRRKRKPTVSREELDQLLAEKILAEYYGMPQSNIPVTQTTSNVPAE